MSPEIRRCPVCGALPEEDCQAASEAQMAECPRAPWQSIVRPIVEQHARQMVDATQTHLE